MYGLLINVLRAMVIREYGDHYWKEVCLRSSMPDMEDGALGKESYDEVIMNTLISTSADVLGVDVKAILELFGEQFFRNMKHSGHYRVIRCLGNTLEGFLLNLDALHDHFAIAYPKMRAPSFRAEKSPTGLLLHYFSCRKGLYPMVIGLVKVIAKEVYDLNVNVSLVDSIEEGAGAFPYHYKLSIDMIETRRRGRGSALGRMRGNSIVPEIESLPMLPLSGVADTIRYSGSNSQDSASSPRGSPQLFHPGQCKEERSQSTGQILRERSGTSSMLLHIPNVAELSRLCSRHLAELPEEEEEEEEEEEKEKEKEEEEEEKKGEREDVDTTPIPKRHNLTLASASPSLSPPATPPPMARVLASSPSQCRSMFSANDYEMFRRRSSQNSLADGLPTPVLPSLPLNSISTSRLPHTLSHSTSSVNLDKRWPVTKSLFQICFPFHIIFDADLTIHYMGVSMFRLLPNAIAQGDKITDHFKLMRPIGTFNYHTVRHSIHNPFILEMKTTPPLDEAENHENKAVQKPLQFRGQMVPVINAESCPILFIGSPRIETVEELQVKGLYLTDLPIHDVTRDLILLSQHFRAEVNLAFQLETTKRELEQEKKRVQEEKQRADTLLHTMLPPSVARELTSTGAHEQVVIAEEVQMVTILFSDIREFTTICHRCSPMEVVSMLNDLYTKFDSYIDRHKVYKVETIGDAYMVAAGLLDTSPHHAEAVTNMAFDMRHAASLVTTPRTSDSIKIRIGIHSGHVVAGVVGTKMPRYCLFGDTVNTASRMESHGDAGRIHISQMTYKKLRGRPYLFWNRGKIRVKGLPELQQTYFVEPGEDHELSETMHIMVGGERDSDSDWEEADYNAFRRQNRQPSFVRYKNMKVVPQSTRMTSNSSVTDDNSSLISRRLSSPRRLSSSFFVPVQRSSPPHLRSMKEKLVGKLSLGSIGSFSLSQGLSSFIEHDEGTFRELGVDLPPCHLGVEKRVSKERKVSSASDRILLRVEPEGQSVTFTREPLSRTASGSPSSPSISSPGEGEEDDDDHGIDMRVRSKSESVARKSKKHKHRKSSRCKVS